MSVINAIRFWGLSISGWLAIFGVVAMFPGVQLPCMVLLICILFSKVFSLLHGVMWIWNCGAKAATELHARELETPLPTAADRLRMVFAEFAATSIQRSLFGVFDWQLLKSVEIWSAKDALWITGSTCLRWVRNLFYRFEALMVLSTMALVFRPYSPDDLRSALLAYATILAVLVNVTLMAIEILVGNFVMGPGYDRYCHRHVESPAHNCSRGGRDSLRSIGNFARLAVFSLVAIAAVMHSLHAADAVNGVEGFRAVESIKPDNATSATFENRIHAYGEFVAFTLTTFATVGYGDVHPITLHNRLVVGYLHVLGMGMVLVLLQVVLGPRDWPKETPTNPSASAGPTPHSTVTNGENK